MTVLVTGAAGFVGFHVAQRLLAAGDTVVGIDNLNDYYAPDLKRDRLRQLEPHSGFSFQKLDIADRTAVADLFQRHRFDRVVHLAAQAGVRYSLSHPHAYVNSNLIGFLNILEGCRAVRAGHLVYASSSSVYGANTRMPFSVHDGVDHPLSLYAATKKSNEMMAHAYAHLYSLPVTGLRFFTVYGPWGRPDMAYFQFTDKILRGDEIAVYNNGEHARDFTYIDDVVDAVVRLLAVPATAAATWSAEAPDPATSAAPYRLYNVGNTQPAGLMDFIAVIERATGREARKVFHPKQAGDVAATWADIAETTRDAGFKPRVGIEEGIGRFVAWYRDYYKV